MLFQTRSLATTVSMAPQFLLLANMPQCEQILAKVADINFRENPLRVL
jgi:hypothetical protein